jgi:hypothetical protein
VVIVDEQLQAVLCGAAMRYCAAGWPIAPTQPPAHEGVLCQRGPAGPGEAQEWWSERSYGIAARTGVLFDALQLPAWLGERLLPSVQHRTGVIVEEGPEYARWRFLVSPGCPSIAELGLIGGAYLIGAGRWVLLPPTRVIGGTTRWVARPPVLATVADTVPHSLRLQWAAVHAVAAARHDRNRPVADRMVSPAGRRTGERIPVAETRSRL